VNASWLNADVTRKRPEFLATKDQAARIGANCQNFKGQKQLNREPREPREKKVKSPVLFAYSAYFAVNIFSRLTGRLAVK